jgi:hypothetical protein
LVRRVLLGAALLGFCSFATAQSIAYSYLGIAISGQPVTNFVDQKKYIGWLRIEDPEVRFAVPQNSSVARGRTASVKVATVNSSKWKSLVATLRSNESGPGQFRFGAGDDGGMAPLVKAQKQKTLVPDAELDLYNENTNQFVGKVRIKGVRVLSLRDVQASACPMYDVILSFQSIVKE